MFNNLCAFVFKTRNYNDVTRSYFVYVHRLVLFIGITNRTINILNTHFVTNLMIFNAREGPAIPCVGISYNLKFPSLPTAVVSKSTYCIFFKILLYLQNVTSLKNNNIFDSLLHARLIFK